MVFLHTLLFCSEADIFIKGADISFLPEIESRGGSFYENGEKKDIFLIMKNAGINTVRLRVWIDNPDGESSIEKSVALSKRAKEYSMRIIVDLHYSSIWADPSQQTKPDRWKNLSFAELCSAVEKYSFEVINSFKTSGVDVDFVQVGNEIGSGFLWDTGKIGGVFDKNWADFGKLINRGVSGVRKSCKKSKIIIHHNNGYNYNQLVWFYGNIRKYVKDYDIIGVSYYPFYHGTNLSSLKKTFDSISRGFGKPLVIVETAYPWCTDWADNTNNIFWTTSDYIEDFPPDRDGQKDYLKALLSLVRDVDSNNGLGVVYWAPEWIPVKGYGSTWENLTLFDFEGNSLPGLYSFGE